VWLEKALPFRRVFRRGVASHRDALILALHFSAGFMIGKNDRSPVGREKKSILRKTGLMFSITYGRKNAGFSIFLMTVGTAENSSINSFVPTGLRSFFLSWTRHWSAGLRSERPYGTQLQPFHGDGLLKIKQKSQSWHIYSNKEIYYLLLAIGKFVIFKNNKSPIANNKWPFFCSCLNRNKNEICSDWDIWIICSHLSPWKGWTQLLFETHAGTAEPFRVSPTEAVFYHFELFRLIFLSAKIPRSSAQIRG
jgi:hypothetical protein